MSREIKFRVWDKVDCVMDDVTAINWKQKHANIAPVGLLGMNRVDIMQYTGLKDKNGKEIYEGDILHTDEVKNGDHTIFKRTVEVKWESGKAMNGWSFSVRDAEVMEVIGNIYQNPELLSLDNK